MEANTLLGENGTNLMKIDILKRIWTGQPFIWKHALKLPTPPLEEKLTTILDSEAPMGVFQRRTQYLKWLNDDTKKI